ncbi:hypothetical protein EN993_02825 [Mesorhizobium sp. M7D.F.Ca.US.004.01.2.1]|nr:hypothetical protein EN993_02825 [Mesorhizobium sp. M7D.F.Ca.US.004.01.2.1]
MRISLLPLWEKVSPKATDEGCSRKRQRLTPLEHPSSVSALRADPPSPTRGLLHNSFRGVQAPKLQSARRIQFRTNAVGENSGSSSLFEIRFFGNLFRASPANFVVLELCNRPTRGEGKVVPLQLASRLTISCWA